jgi:hypothetical protein
LPTGTDDLENVYAAPDLANVATVDASTVDQTGADEYIIHQYKDFISTNATYRARWVGKSTLAPRSSPVYLQVYNWTTEAWVTVDSDNSTGALVDFTLEAVLDSVTDYKNSSDVVVCRVYQLAT